MLVECLRGVDQLLIGDVNLLRTGISVLLFRLEILVSFSKPVREFKVAMIQSRYRMSLVIFPNVLVMGGTPNERLRVLHTAHDPSLG